jgi:hypothetical protein
MDGTEDGGKDVPGHFKLHVDMVAEHCARLIAAW